MRGLRIAGIVAASVAVLLVVALLLAWQLFDPNDHKARMQSVFRDVTGRELQLDGDLSLSVFPWLAIESGAAAIANRAGFGDEPFAALERARLGVRLWPLLSRRRVEFGPVRVDGLALNLAVAKDGSNNWSDLLDRLERRDRAPGPDDAGGSADAGPSVASVELRDARVSFVDAQADTSYALTEWNLQTGRLRKGEPVDVDTSLRLARNARDLGRFAVRTRIDLAQPDRVLLAGTEGEVRLARAAQEPMEVALRTPQVVMTSATRDIEVQDLETRLGQAVLTTNLRIEQGDVGPTVKGDLRLAETDPRALLAALGLDTPRTRDPQALRRLSATSKLTYSSARGLQFEALEVRLDDTRLAGRFGARAAKRLALRLDLRGAALDLDRYLPPAGPPPSASKRVAGDHDGRRAVDLRGSVALDRLVVAKVALQDARLELRLQDGRLSLEPLRARAFGGSIVTRLQYDLAAAEPSLRVDQQLTGVDVAALLGQSFGLEQLQGRGDGKFSLASRGPNAQALIANLRGPFEFTVVDGAVIGVDLWYEIERAVAAARLAPAAATATGSGRTKFERFSARGTLAERTLHNDRLEFITDFARVHGDGKVDYGRSALDLDLAARLLKAPQGRLLGVKVSRLKDADIPLRITGTLAEPKVRPDVSKLLEAMAKDAIKEPLEGKIKEELEKIFKF